MVTISKLEAVSLVDPTIADFDYADGTGADVNVKNGATLAIDWETIYSDHFEMLVTRLMTLHGRDRMRAENDAQEAIIKLFDANREGTAFRKGSTLATVNLGGWLWTTARRQSIDGMRADAKLTSADQNFGTDDEPVALSDMFAAPEMTPADLLDSEKGATVANLSVKARATGAGNDLIDAIRKGTESNEWAGIFSEMMRPVGKQTVAGNRRMVRVLILRACGYDTNEISEYLGVAKNTMPKMYQRAAKMAQSAFDRHHTARAQEERANVTMMRNFAAELSSACETMRARMMSREAILATLESVA